LGVLRLHALEWVHEVEGAVRRAGPHDDGARGGGDGLGFEGLAALGAVAPVGEAVVIEVHRPRLAPEWLAWVARGAGRGAGDV
jgi:hypothetical protein